MAANAKDALDGVKGEEDMEVTVSGEAGELPSGKFVKYVGSATRRVLTAEDWASIGAKSGKDVEWSFSNGFKVESEKFTKGQLEYLLKKDGNFQVSND